jgi:hypothetical protein
LRIIALSLFCAPTAASVIGRAFMALETRTTVFSAAEKTSNLFVALFRHNYALISSEEAFGLPGAAMLCHRRLRLLRLRLPFGFNRLAF